jgi:hypothetical protein
MTEIVAGRRYDAALHLLDRQIIDPDGRLVGNVDDLELVERGDGTLVVATILTGPGALGPRLGGLPGRWVVAIWRRLRSDSDPAPGRIDAGSIADIDSAVHLNTHVEGPGIDGLETWTRTHIVERIPGGRHDPG